MGVRLRKHRHDCTCDTCSRRPGKRVCAHCGDISWPDTTACLCFISDGLLEDRGLWFDRREPERYLARVGGSRPYDIEWLRDAYPFSSEGELRMFLAREW